MKTKTNKTSLTLRDTLAESGLFLEAVENLASLNQNPVVTAFGGGGRYDNLIAKYSNFSIPAIGFSIGIDRVELVLKSLGLDKNLNKYLPQVDYYIAAKNKASRKKAVQLAQKLRSQDKNVELDLMEKRLSDQLNSAKKINAQEVIIANRACYTMRTWSQVSRCYNKKIMREENV